MQDIDSLLNKTLEIEGLLRLVAVRDDDDAAALLRHKARELSEALDACMLAMEVESAPIDSMVNMSESAQPIPSMPESQDATMQESPDIARSGTEEICAEEPVEIDTDVSASVVELEPEDTGATIGAGEPVHEAQDEAPRPAAPAPKSFITFNEKYRFARELFNNQHGLMSDVVAKVTAMHSLPEAHDYVLNELNLDEDNPVVIEFLEVIARYFNSRT